MAYIGQVIERVNGSEYLPYEIRKITPNSDQADTSARWWRRRGWLARREDWGGYWVVAIYRPRRNRPQERWI